MARHALFRFSEVDMKPVLLPLSFGFAVTALLAACGAQPTSQGDGATFSAASVKRAQFVTRAGPQLRLDGRPFRFSGTNNYYLTYKSNAMVDAVLQSAAKNDFKVLRTWGFLEASSPSATDNSGPKEGVYLQTWGNGRPVVNEGASGLQKLDYVIYRAGQLGIKLVIPLTNNWADFGGMDQYVKWRGGKYHDEFYTDPTIRAWYKAYAGALLNRKNSYTGVAYKDDPTIMLWELANEPRCKGSGELPTSPNCSTDTLTTWAAEMSAYLKKHDKNHLVAVGDEGFYCNAGAGDWTENCGEGVDSRALTKLPHIDVMSLHLYPDHWGKDAAWGRAWITRHLQDARKAGKAVMLGEFGLSDKGARDAVYKEWTNAVKNGGGNGDLHWMLAEKQDDGTYYPDYDGFTVYCPSSTCTVLSQHAREMAGQRVTPAPTARDDEASVKAGESVTLNVLANDAAAPGARLNPASLDLDATAPGLQSVKSVREGTFRLENGQVTFTSNGLAGSAAAAYTVQDSLGQTSNRAAVSVSIQGGGATTETTLFDFEDGAAGWGPINGPTHGSVTASGDFHPSGAAGVKISALAGGDWFGTDLPNALSLSGKSTLKFDLKTASRGTSYSLALKVGSGWTWCQAPGFINVPADSTVTASIDLTALSCAADLGEVHGLYVWLSEGEFLLDHVRVE